MNNIFHLNDGELAVLERALKSMDNRLRLVRERMRKVLVEDAPDRELHVPAYDHAAAKIRSELDEVDALSRKLLSEYGQRKWDETNKTPVGR